MRFILASSSPRRKELLKKVVSDFCVIVPDAEETEEGTPEEIAKANAQRKGRAVAGERVIACDTLVALNGKVYGKPHTAENAEKMLTELSGKTHEVISGLYVRLGEKEYLSAERSTVTFYDLSPEKIKEYVDTYQPFDKAGAYGIQDGFVVKSYAGSYDNIVGLPTEKLKEILGG